MEWLAGFAAGFLISFAPFAIYLGWRTTDWLWRKWKYRHCRYCMETW